MNKRQHVSHAFSVCFEPVNLCGVVNGELGLG